MPFHVEVDEEEIDEMVLTSGRCSSTLRSKATVEKCFAKFAHESGFSTLEALIKKKDELESLLIKYFHSMRVKATKEVPKKNTVELHKSHIKMLLLQKSEGELDIGNCGTFSKFCAFMKTYFVSLKKLGKSDTSHRPEIPATSLERIYEFLSILSDLMVMDESDIEFEAKLSALPQNMRSQYHYLVQYGVIFVILSQFARRGREGIDQLTKSHIQLQEDPNSGKKYFKKVIGEYSKNHRDDDEDLETGGIVLFEENAMGFNPGDFIQRYLEKLPPESALIFTRPKRKSQHFNLFANPNVWYEKTKIGPSQVGKALPELSNAIGIPRIINAQVRPTSIRLLKRSGAEDREISSISGHKSLETLAHYDPKPTLKRQMEMARAIVNGGAELVSMATTNEMAGSASLDCEEFIDMDPPNAKKPMPSATITSDASEKQFVQDEADEIIATNDPDEKHEDNFVNEDPPDAGTTKEEIDKEEKGHKMLILSQDHEEPSLRTNESSIEALLRREQQLAAQNQEIYFQGMQSRLNLAEMIFKKAK